MTTKNYHTIKLVIEESPNRKNRDKLQMAIILKHLYNSPPLGDWKHTVPSGDCKHLLANNLETFHISITAPLWGLETHSPLWGL